jgi:tetratricopeptide (TPR) repeat protein
LQVFPLVEESWREARNKLEPFLKEQPDNYALIGDLALTNMGLGDKAAALALSEQAIAVNPIEKDAIVGPIPIEILARVAAQLGEPDRAIAALQKLLSIPYAGALAEAVPLTPALLRLDPMFDPLSDALFPESLKLLWELRVPHVVRPQIDNGYLHPVLYFTCAQIVQQRSPFLEFAQIFTDVFGE